MIKKREKGKVILGVTPEEEEYLKKSTVEVRKPSDLAKSILNVMNGPEFKAERLAFETDPSMVQSYGGLYKPKLRLIPDVVLKRIAIQDSLVANIVRARQNHVSAFGRPRYERHELGYLLKPNAGVTDKMDDEQQQKLAAKIKRAVALIQSCGHLEGRTSYSQKRFSDWLSLTARDVCVVGRLATEIVHRSDLLGNRKEFHYFTHTDAGTIYQAAVDDEKGKAAVRKAAYDLLCQVTGDKKLVKEKKLEDKDYTWAQVIDGTPKQFFTDDEMKCANFYPTGNIELDGYPVTPIDTVISAVTTHLNITTHNKVYFQSGRATRGMLVIKSDDMNPNVLHNIKQSFNASINSCTAAFRMPVFAIPTEGNIQWMPIDNSGSRDMEFQYLTDMNAREILTAFMMSPDELPGWSYLSRGTNSQALSESKNEYTLSAARDVGLRPLLNMFEQFINAEILPLIDEELSKQVRFIFAGLDADSPEKEIVNLQQNSQVWMTMNDILEKLERKPIDKRWCSEIPLNPVYKSYLDQYHTVGVIKEHWCGEEGASKDPRWDYPRDPLYFQNWQLRLQEQQLQLQQQQMQMQAQQLQQPQEGQEAGPKDLSSGIDQAYDLMNKSEENFSPEKRKVLHRQQRALKWLTENFQSDLKDATREILEIAKKQVPRSK